MGGKPRARRAPHYSESEACAGCGEQFPPRMLDHTGACSTCRAPAELAFAAGWEARDEWPEESYNEAFEHWRETGDAFPDPHEELERAQLATTRVGQRASAKRGGR